MLAVLEGSRGSLYWASGMERVDGSEGSTSAGAWLEVCLFMFGEWTEDWLVAVLVDVSSLSVSRCIRFWKALVTRAARVSTSFRSIVRD
jgi:hypothetical protein